MLGGSASLNCVMLAVIGRPSKNVGLQFGRMSATNFANIFMVSASVAEQPVRCIKLKSNHYHQHTNAHFFTDQMPDALPGTQLHQMTEGNS